MVFNRFSQQPALEKVLLYCLGVLLSFLWLTYALAEVLGPPDFYLYYAQGKKILNLDFTNLVIPPLFPLFLGLISYMGGLFFASNDAILWAGRSLSLIASLGSVFFLYRLAGHFFKQGRIVIVYTVCLSHIFLTHLSIPITDQIYLCFFLGSFAGFAGNNSRQSLLFALLAAMTRFEGIMLFFIIAALSFIRDSSRKNRWILTLLALLSVIAIYLVFAAFFPGKLVFLKAQIASSNGITYFILNPSHLAELIFSNIFFFAPNPAPTAYKLVSMVALAVLILAGFFLLFKKNRFLAWLALLYAFFFILFKGYLSYSPAHELHTRRLLTPLILFLLISAWGLQYLFKIAAKKKKLVPAEALALVFVVFLLIQIPSSSKAFNFLNLLAFLPPVFLMLLNSRRWAGLRLLLLPALILLLSANFTLGHRQSLNEVVHIPNKGAYAIAQYVNNRPQKEPFSLWSSFETYSFYRKNQTKIVWISNYYESDDSYLDYLKKTIKQHGIRYIAFDFYLGLPDEFRTKVKLFFMRHAHNQEFFLARPLYYKGQVAAFILYPRFN